MTPSSSPGDADAAALPMRVARLAQVARRMAPPVFAVLDGGHFADLPSSLSSAGLVFRSLFLGDGHPEAQRFGPWLVTIGQPEQVDVVLGIIGDHPAVVFWSCPSGGEASLLRHLRRLNKVRLPVWAAAGKPGPDPAEPADLRSEVVLFRHWDPRVLATFFPVLDEGGFSRMLGPAAEVAFQAEGQGGPKRVVADPAWPVVPAGMLVVTPDQAAALSDRRRAVSQGRVAAYLRGMFPEIDAHLPDGGLASLVRESEASGRALGIRTEAGHKRWAYLVVASDGQVTRTPGALEFIRSEGRSPDDQVRVMIDMLAARVRGPAVRVP